jgi:hypothetical protein
MSFRKRKRDPKSSAPKKTGLRGNVFCTHYENSTHTLLEGWTPLPRVLIVLVLEYNRSLPFFFTYRERFMRFLKSRVHTPSTIKWYQQVLADSLWMDQKALLAKWEPDFYHIFIEQNNEKPLIRAYPRMFKSPLGFLVTLLQSLPSVHYK